MTVLETPLEPSGTRPGVPRIWVLALVLALTLVAVVAAGLWQLRRTVIEGQARELSVLSLALADELDRGLQGLELVLQATRLDLREGRIPLQGDASSQALHARGMQLRLLRKLWIVDADGYVLASSGAPPTIDADSFLPSLDALDGESSAISRPFLDMTAHEMSVALAVRFVDAAGDRGGWVLAALPAESLRGAFTMASPAADARMAIYRNDGARLVGSVVDGPAPSEAESAVRLQFERLSVTRRLSDGRERLLELRSLPRFGLKLVLTRDVEAVLAPWREVARFATAGLVLLLMMIAGVVHLIQRAERRRAETARALQAQLSRTNRLESLGTLAGGVAHDFNNVLAAMLGYAEMARQSAAPGSAQARQLDHVLQAALRGKALVERILAFSRSGARASTVFEVQPVVEEVLTLMGGSLRAEVRLERDLQAPGATLKGDPTQVFEATMNLCTNAVEAMPAGGTLTVALRTQSVAAPRLTSHGQLQPGRYVVLDVSDQGDGIAPEVMDRLFEPFFTTRGARSGTGLGLAVVHGVVTEHGGAIDVQSQPGQGARFRLYLPWVEGLVVSAPRRASEPDEAELGQGQTLLVVDDEPALVELAEEMLASLGYEPRGYRDPKAALEALRAEPGAFDAVLTDEVMPGLTGTELTRALRAFAPQLPVLLVSGYGGPQLAARAAQAGVTQVLAKPLERTELARALAQVLAAPATLGLGDEAGRSALPPAAALPDTKPSEG